MLNRRQFGLEKHPADEQLQGFCDHELPRRLARDISEHVETCWVCRARLAKIDDVVSAYVAFHKAVYNDDVLASKGPKKFQQEIARALSRKSDSRRSPTGSNAPFSFPWGNENVRRAWIRPAGGLAVVASIIAAITLMFGPKIQPVSAAELLNRSLQKEKAVNLSGTVVHRVVEVEQIDPYRKHSRRHKIDVWQCGARDLLARRVFDADGKLVGGEWSNGHGPAWVYGRTKITRQAQPSGNLLAKDSVWKLLPSADTFLRLTNGAQGVSVEEKASSYVLHFANPQGGAEPQLVRATLTLRRSDFHAVAQTLSIERSGRMTEYDFSETSFLELPFSDVNARVFRVDAGLFEPAIPQSSIRAALAPLVSLPELQVRALSDLDRVGALSQEQIKVTRQSNNSLEISGVVADQARKSAVLGALGKIATSPNVHISISTVAELQRSLPPGQSSKVIVQAVTSDASMQVPPLLQAYFAQHGGLSGDELARQVAKLSNGILTSSANAQLNATVLLHVLESLKNQDASKMSVADRERLENIITRHVDLVRSNLKGIRSALAPMLGNPQPLDDTPGEDSPGLYQSSVQLATLTATIDQMLSQTFATSGLNSQQPSTLAPQLWRALRQAEDVSVSIANRARDQYGP